MTKKQRKSNLGFTLIEALIVGAILGIILIVWGVTLSAKSTEVRDMRRLKDINEIRNGLNLVKTHNGTYESASCSVGTISSCSQNKSSELLKFVSGLANINDPKELQPCPNVDTCAENACNYTLTKLQENEYEVIFHLEKGNDQYPSKGCYMLTQDGIVRIK